METHSWTWQLLPKQTITLAFAVKSIGLVAGPLNGFDVIADIEQIWWNFIACEINKVEPELQKDGPIESSVVAQDALSATML